MDHGHANEGALANAPCVDPLYSPIQSPAQCGASPYLPEQFGH